MVPLGTTWEIDHITRWADGGDSNPMNLQPLCKKCHQRKTAMENSNHNSPIRLKDWGIQEDGSGILRRGHRDGLLMICKKFQIPSNRFCSIVLPTRYGKSDLARMVTYAGCFGLEGPDGQIIPPFISHVLFLTHRNFLRTQIRNIDKWEGCKKRQGIVSPDVPRMGDIDYAPGHPKNIAPNGEQFLCTSINNVANNLEVYNDWVSFKRENGLPILVFADEAQFFGEEEARNSSETLKWGEALVSLAENGANVITMTATPVRADKKLIPGFKTLITQEGEERFQKVVTKRELLVDENGDVKYDSAGKPLYRISFEDRKQTSDYFELLPDFEVERREAWNNQYLCQLNRNLIEIKMTSGEMLHELNPQQCRRELGHVLRRDDVITECLKRAVTELKTYRRDILPKAGMIIFASNEKQGDSQVEQIKAILRANHPSMTFREATQNSGGQTAIDEFVAGHYDILILKQMAGAGLDAERCKVVCDLSPVRQLASCEQRWNRAATPTRGKGGKRVTVASIVMPRDTLSDTIFRTIYTEEGGESKRTQSEILREGEEVKPQGDAPEPIFVDEIQDEVVHDTNGREARGQEADMGRGLISRLLSKGADLGITIPLAAELANEMNLTPEQVGVIHDEEVPAAAYDTTTAIGRLRTQITSQAKEWAMFQFHRMHGRSYQGSDSDKTQYAYFMRSGWAKVYELTALNSREYKSTRDERILSRVLEQWKALCKEEATNA
jgi:superfamily II DNA or RNA helicase